MNEHVYTTSNCGVRMPRVIYGTAWKKQATASYVKQAIAAGFRGIDTACHPKHYDEAGVGAGVAGSLGPGLARADLYLQTKFTPLSGHDPARVPYDADAPATQQVAQSFALSLRNLQTDYLDGLILHSPMRDARETLQAWRAMEALVDSGAVKQLGVSNFYDSSELQELFRAARVRPAVVQNRFYADTDYDRGIRAFCREQGVIYQSFWTLSANPHLLAHATLRSLAAKYSRTPAQVLFRYLTQNGVVPLTGTTSETHLRESLAIFEFELSAGECAALSELL